MKNTPGIQDKPKLKRVQGTKYETREVASGRVRVRVAASTNKSFRKAKDSKGHCK